jgi:hypothetical protein
MPKYRDDTSLSIPLPSGQALPAPANLLAAATAAGV